MVIKIPGGWRKRRGSCNPGASTLEAAAPSLLPQAQRQQWRQDLAVALEREMLVGLNVAPQLVAELRVALTAIIDLEADALSLPGRPPSSLLEAVTRRNRLRAMLLWQPRAPELIAAWRAGLVALFGAIVAAAPSVPNGLTAFSITVPLIDLVTEPLRLITELVAIILRFAEDDPDAVRPGAVLARHVKHALLRVSKLSEDAARKNPYRLLSPAASGLAGVELVTAFLGSTPLASLLSTALALPVSDEVRFEHTHIVAPTGHGKTQSLEHYIAADITRPPAQVPAAVIIDSKGRMLKRIAERALFTPGRGALADRLIIIDPTDIDHPPALNVFDVNLARFKSYGRRHEEQILNGVIELYDYLFGSLLDADMTQRQRLIFRYLARLMLVIPDATILTLRDLLDEAQGHDIYAAWKDRLHPSTQNFFECEFFGDKQYKATRAQIRRRLLGVLENPTFERLFSARKNRIDLYDALNAGKIVLVNTAQDFLKDERSSLLGRTFIALTLQAVLERAPIPPEQRRPTFLIVDEAQEYFDGKIDHLLTQARQYKCGLVLAHQYLDQLKHGLAASIAANTTIKLAGGTSDADARALAPNMRCRPEFISGHGKTATATTFAAYVRNMTPHATTLTVPFGALDRVPKMSAPDYAQLLAANRARISSTEPPSPATLATPQPDTSPSTATDPWRS